MIHVIRYYLQKQSRIFKSKVQSARERLIAASAEGPDLRLGKDLSIPAGLQGLCFGRAAAAPVCSISDCQHLPGAFRASPMRPLVKESVVVYSSHPVWPRPIALATCFSENPTGKGEMCLLMDNFSQLPSPW